jgi:signal transduction histidine kinase
MKKPKHPKRYKSLKNRFKIIVNISTLLTVLIMSIMFLFVVNRMITEVGTAASSYYVDRIQDTLTRSNEINDENMFQKEMEKLSSVFPIFSIRVVINNQVVFNSTAEGFYNKFQENKMPKEQIAPPSIDAADNFQGIKVTKQLVDKNNNTVGEARVGVNNRIQLIIYIGIIITLLIGGIIVIIIMKIITSIMTKPILNPLSSLQKRMEELADENIDNIKPTLILDKKSVQEVCDLTNVTNRLLNKMVEYNEVITQSEKMASVGQLTAAITHEINTPLGAINSNVNMIKLLSEEAETSDDKEMLQSINQNIKESAALSEEACMKIQEIIKSLRSFSRIDQADFMPADINDSIRSVIILTTNLHKNRIQIIEKFGDIPEVSCYIGLMNQVFMNIIINAIQAIDGKGTITIETSADETYAYAKFTDTGCGISPKNIYRIFEYGFTTKQPGSGSGIGLALSKNIIKKHNGEILVDSKEGQGTTFTIKILIIGEKTQDEKR